MAAATVLNVNYEDSTRGPWPWILRLIAIFVLIVVAARAAMLLADSWSFLPFGKAPPIALKPRQIGFLMIAGGIGLVIDAVQIIGSVQLLRRGNWRLLVSGLWMMILFWVVTFLLALFFFWPRQNQAAMISSSMVYNMERGVFPVMVLLCLRAAHVR